MNSPPTNGKRRVLLIEDEPGLVLTLTDRLETAGFQVSHAGTGTEGLRLARGARFDLIVLDVMLPGMDGFEVCSRLRRHGVRTPVLMLTARGEVQDRVRGLDSGADDYLGKPFEMIELMARIQALLRRAEPPGSSELVIGEARVDLDAGTINRDGRKVEVSPLSLRLLSFLVANPGQTHSREALLTRVWGHRSLPSTRTVDVHIAALRRALEEDPGNPQFIVTVHTVGYRFEAQPPG
ncbi:MAG: response regulator transcription factor [Proteobacteria bacterium]|jgi:two-component system alkaline phosphatase synthesis response regulator PhoP|nr:response regulator transcription factor [Pseudomonadota bacterium]MDA1301949.1 response regulator transcription factor [Pseudomonadota bacterium]